MSFPNAFIEKTLKAEATIRNWETFGEMMASSWHYILSRSA